MPQPRWLVTGASGQVGGAVARLAPLHGAVVDAPTRDALNLEHPAAIADMVSSGGYDAVINCAAYTAVDRAEAEPELAMAINGRAPGLLAEATAQAGIPLIHVSTDYVFDGDKDSPYTETDAVNPLGVYGRTKEAGEAAIRTANPRHAIVRTAWVLSAGGANFLNTMLRLGAERDSVAVVGDQIGCPTNASDLAEALIHIAFNLGQRSGTWHFVNDGETSWHDLAKHIFAAAASRGLKTPALSRITTADYPTPARRPANSRLETNAIRRDFGIAPRHWHDAVDAILAERLD